MKGPPAPVGTLLMSFKLTIGKVCRTGVPVYFNEAIISVAAPFRELDEFLFRFLPVLAAGGSAKGAIKGNTLNADSIANMPIPFPPLAEQRRIIAKVDELMALCDELDVVQAIETASRNRARASAIEVLTRANDAQALGQAWRRIQLNWTDLTSTSVCVAELRDLVRDLAVFGHLTEQYESDQPAAALLDNLETGGSSNRKRSPEVRSALSLPTTWEWARFDQVAIIESDLVDPAGYPSSPHVAPDSIVKRQGKLLGNRSIIEDGVTSGKHRFHSGQILYSKIRPALSKVVLVDFDGLCSADMYPITSRIDTRYLFVVMLSPYFVSVVTADDNRLAMPKVNQKQLSAVVIPVPPLAEQGRIVKKVDELLEMCDDLESALNLQDDTAGALAASVAARYA